MFPRLTNIRLFSTADTVLGRFPDSVFRRRLCLVPMKYKIQNANYFGTMKGVFSFPFHLKKFLSFGLSLQNGTKHYAKFFGKKVSILHFGF
jgi:hypothetical protein